MNDALVKSPRLLRWCKTFALAAMIGTGVSVIAAPSAEARVYVGVGLGFGGGWGGGFGGGYYHPWGWGGGCCWGGPGYYGGFYGPPAVVYAPPPVVYAPPPEVVYPAPSVSPVQATPASPAYYNNGRYCREYQATVNVDGQNQPSHGTACQDADGTWRIVN